MPVNENFKMSLGDRYDEYMKLEPNIQEGIKQKWARQRLQDTGEGTLNTYMEMANEQLEEGTQAPPTPTAMPTKSAISTPPKPSTPSMVERLFDPSKRVKPSFMQPPTPTEQKRMGESSKALGTITRGLEVPAEIIHAARNPDTSKPFVERLQAPIRRGVEFFRGEGEPKASWYEDPLMYVGLGGLARSIAPKTFGKVKGEVGRILGKGEAPLKVVPKAPVDTKIRPSISLPSRIREEISKPQAMKQAIKMTPPVKKVSAPKIKETPVGQVSKTEDISKEIPTTPAESIKHLEDTVNQILKESGSPFEAR